MFWAKSPAVHREIVELHLALAVGKGYRQPRGIQLAEDAVDIVMTCADAEIGIGRDRRVKRSELEAEIIRRPSGRADDVGGKTPELIEQDRGLLVPVGIELNAALLSDDAAEVLEPIERYTTEVGFHDGSP